MGLSRQGIALDLACGSGTRLVTNNKAKDYQHLL
jgi:hypothetical protein